MGLAKKSLFLSVLVLTACTDTALEITSDTVKPRKGVAVSAERLLGDGLTVVRTYVEDENGKKTEVAGARCTLKSRELSAALTTPARVSIPIYVQGARFENRGRPSDMTVTCKAKGLATTTVVEALPFGPGNTTSSTQYYNGTNYSGGTHVFTNNAQLSSSFPWSYGSDIRVILAEK